MIFFFHFFSTNLLFQFSFDFYFPFCTIWSCISSKFFHWKIALIQKLLVILNFRWCYKSFYYLWKSAWRCMPQWSEILFGVFWFFYTTASFSWEIYKNCLWFPYTKWSMQMHENENENTFLKMNFPYCEVEPGIIRSKREHSTTDLIM